MSKYYVLELFAGAGGLALGLEKAGFTTIGLVEIDKYACETLKENRPHWNILHMDIQQFNQNINRYDYPAIDLISGGFPCQPFSYAGAKRGLEDTRGTLFYEFASTVRQLKPKMLLAENVKGLKSHDNGKTFQTILDVLEEIGYNLQYEILNAVDYGVAQKRERLIIIGTRKDLNTDYRFPHKQLPRLTLRDVLTNVPDSGGFSYPEKKRQVLDLVPAGGYWRDLPEEVAKEYMAGSYYLGGGKTGMARRISWDEPSLTLTCSPAQKQTERCHPDETRPFTVREYARIQSFPDDWIFAGSISQQYKQIGNAVPVNLAYHIGTSIFHSLERMDSTNDYTGI